jgi:hypothetical protein
MKRLAAMLAVIAFAAQGVPAPPPLPRLPVDKPDPPYPMNYADEAAQALGIAHGRVDVFSAPPRQHGIVPDVKGGIDRGRPMLKLEWPVQ